MCSSKGYIFMPIKIQSVLLNPPVISFPNDNLLFLSFYIFSLFARYDCHTFVCDSYISRMTNPSIKYYVCYVLHTKFLAIVL